MQEVLEVGVWDWEGGGEEEERDTQEKCGIGCKTAFVRIWSRGGRGNLGSEIIFLIPCILGSHPLPGQLHICTFFSAAKYAILHFSHFSHFSLAVKVLLPTVFFSLVPPMSLPLFLAPFPCHPFPSVKSRKCNLK